MRYPFRVVSVFSLLSPSRPSAIARFVVAVVVDAIKCPSTGAVPHVGHKIDEGITPSIADGHPTSAIPVVANPVFVVAPLLHVAPRIVGWASDSTERIPVGKRRVLGACKSCIIAFSHVVTPMMALVRGPAMLDTSQGFAILTERDAFREQPGL